MPVSPRLAVAFVPILAHGGAGATWQALVTTIAIGVGIVFLLALAGKLKPDTPGDLVLPLAAVAIISSVGPAASGTLSDAVGWAIPAGVVLLVGLLIASMSDLDLKVPSALGLTTVVVALAASVGLSGPLTDALHPPLEFLPLSDDATLTLAAPEDQSTVTAGSVQVRVDVTGATIGPGGLTSGPDDPEELTNVRLTVDSEVLQVAPEETCAVDDPCTSVTFVVDLEPGQHRVIAELVAWDGRPLAPAVFDAVTFTAE